ncbi:MAG: aminotransferase class III-fold pyridoxal phosphate-dependent enzyme [Gammaproteobacteria bacterium]|nr:aminotransferase class III-fold pyridoxal phosphate-dependent enzyme [Gammaproteobacteria bacterium]
MSALLHPASNLHAVKTHGQFVVERGEGVYIYDNHGKAYLEGMAGLWCTGLGYGNQEVAQIAQEQISKLAFSHMFAGKSHEPGNQLADKLASMVPIDNAHIFLGSSGSDANDTQVKFMRYFNTITGKPQKTKIIARDKGYHGVTMTSAALTGLPIFHSNYQLPLEALGVVRVSAPYYFRNGLPGESEQAFVDRLVKELEDTIEREGADTIAAMICEPINGAGGVIVPPEGYFARVQQVLKQNDIQLIDDEVITGFGRTGEVFGAHSFDIQPDTMSMAKQLTSAYLPLSAVAVNATMFDAMVEESARAGNNGHGYTYSGHPVAAAVALKVLEIYERDGVYQNAATQGEYMQRKLSAMIDHPMIGDVRGKGLIGAIELVADSNNAMFPNNDPAMYCVKRAEELGLIVRPLSNNTVAMCPPMVITEAQLDELFSKLNQAVEDTYAKFGQ